MSFRTSSRAASCAIRLGPAWAATLGSSKGDVKAVRRVKDLHLADAPVLRRWL